MNVLVPLEQYHSTTQFLQPYATGRYIGKRSGSVQSNDSTDSTSTCTSEREFFIVSAVQPVAVPPVSLPLPLPIAILPQRCPPVSYTNVPLNQGPPRLQLRSASVMRFARNPNTRPDSVRQNMGRQETARQETARLDWRRQETVVPTIAVPGWRRETEVYYGETGRHMETARHPDRPAQTARDPVPNTARETARETGRHVTRPAETTWPKDLGSGRNLHRVHNFSLASECQVQQVAQPAFFLKTQTRCAHVTPLRMQSLTPLRIRPPVTKFNRQATISQLPLALDIKETKPLHASQPVALPIDSPKKSDKFSRNSPRVKTLSEKACFFIELPTNVQSIVKRMVVMLAACGYYVQDLVHVVALAVCQFRRAKLHNTPDATEKAYLFCVQCFLAHCWLLDETCPLRIWHQHVFPKYCELKTLGAACFKLFVLQEMRLGVNDTQVIEVAAKIL
eukprot:Platyproteum_vivax@DN2917_c0_g1_i1.p1